MKRLIFVSIIFASFTFVACKKENIEKIDGTEHSKIENKTNSSSSNLKSGTSDEIDAMAKAANIASIKFVSTSNKFEIDSYDDEKLYEVSVVDFYMDSLISFNISIDGDAPSKAVIDVKLK